MEYLRKGIWKAYRDKALNSSMLLAYEFGDGGGGQNHRLTDASGTCMD